MRVILWRISDGSYDGCKPDDRKQYSCNHEETGKKQVELADGIGVSKVTISKMLNGSRSINAVELKKIAEYLNSSMDTIMQIPEAPIVEMNAIHAFIGKVETEEAREALKVADKVSDLIVFHSRVRRNGINAQFLTRSYIETNKSMGL